MTPKQERKVMHTLTQYSNSASSLALLFEAWDTVAEKPTPEAIREAFTEPLASRIVKAVTT